MLLITVLASLFLIFKSDTITTGRNPAEQYHEGIKVVDNSRPLNRLLQELKFWGTAAVLFRGFDNVVWLSQLGGVEIASNKARFFLAEFEGDPVLVVLPLHWSESSLPVVIYSHGQLEYLTDLTPNYAQKLINWGDMFARRRYIFIAPYFYGDNWGNYKAQNLLYQYHSYLNRVPFVDKKRSYYLAFSMGGRLIYNYLLSDRFAKSFRFNKAVILAGSVWAKYIPKELCKNLKEVSLIIYHGDADVNVPLYMSQNFCKLCQPYANRIHLVVLKGMSHLELGYTEREDILLGTYRGD